MTDLWLYSDEFEADYHLPPTDKIDGGKIEAATRIFAREGKMQERIGSSVEVASKVFSREVTTPETIATSIAVPSRVTIREEGI